MPNPSENLEKRSFLSAALKHGWADVYARGIEYPYRLSWNYGFPLELNQYGVGGTYYNSGVPEGFFIHWDDVDKIVGENGWGQTW